jgi:molybdopterin/thiamine biosynthesis adenylyltransferase
MDITRHKEIFNPEKFTDRVNVIGCGASGSWVVLMLAKLGITDIHVWDFDTIEAHNIPNQAFGIDAVGKHKVEAMELTCFEQAGIDITVHKERVSQDTKLSGVVFMLTDTMGSRNEIFKFALKNNLAVSLLIETRMGAESGRVYTINPNLLSHTKAYSSTLYTDEEATVSLCGIEQSLAPTAMMTASYAVWQLIKWSKNEELANEIIFDIQSGLLLNKTY